MSLLNGYAWQTATHPKWSDYSQEHIYNNELVVTRQTLAVVSLDLFIASNAWDDFVFVCVNLFIKSLRSYLGKIFSTVFGPFSSTRKGLNLFQVLCENKSVKTDGRFVSDDSTKRRFLSIKVIYAAINKINVEIKTEVTKKVTLNND